MSDWRDDLCGDDVPGGEDAAWLDRLFDDPGGDEVPAELESVVGLLLAARAPATEDELAGEAAAMAAFRSALTPAVRPGVTPGRRARGVAVAAAFAVVTATGGAAAAGRLPADVQDLTSEVLDRLGISIPRSDEQRPDIPPPSDGSHLARGQGSALDATDPASPPSSEPRPPAALGPTVSVAPLRSGVVASPAPIVASVETASPPPDTAPADVQPAEAGPAGGTATAAGTSSPTPAAAAAAPSTPSAGPGPTVPPPAAPQGADAPQGGGRPETVPGAEHGNGRAVGRPDDIPANDHAAANAGGPPDDVPAAAQAAPHDDTSAQPGKGHGGPPDDVPANEHAAPHAVATAEPDSGSVAP